MIKSLFSKDLVDIVNEFLKESYSKVKVKKVSTIVKEKVLTTYILDMFKDKVVEEGMLVIALEIKKDKLISYINFLGKRDKLKLVSMKITSKEKKLIEERRKK